MVFLSVSDKTHKTQRETESNKVSQKTTANGAYTQRSGFDPHLRPIHVFFVLISLSWRVSCEYLPALSALITHLSTLSVFILNPQSFLPTKSAQCVAYDEHSRYDRVIDWQLIVGSLGLSR